MNADLFVKSSVTGATATNDQAAGREALPPTGAGAGRGGNHGGA